VIWLGVPFDTFIDQWGGVDFDLMKVTETRVGYSELLADIGVRQRIEGGTAR